MKLLGYAHWHLRTSVAPHAGAWIEIKYAAARGYLAFRVAPHAGAWIEIDKR